MVTIALRITLLNKVQINANKKQVSILVCTYFFDEPQQKRVWDDKDFPEPTLS